MRYLFWPAIVSQLWFIWSIVSNGFRNYSFIQVSLVVVAIFFYYRSWHYAKLPGNTNYRNLASDRISSEASKEIWLGLAGLVFTISAGFFFVVDFFRVASGNS